MDPHGMAMMAFFHGDNNAQLTVSRDDGLETPIPAGHFFRDASAFTATTRSWKFSTNKAYASKGNASSNVRC